MLMVSILQIKSTDWWVQLKNKTQPFFAFRKCISLPKTKYRLKVKGWQEIFQSNGVPKQERVAILISDKVDFKTKLIKKDKVSVY
jgi:hypothetical protein